MLSLSTPGRFLVSVIVVAGACGFSLLLGEILLRQFVPGSPLLELDIYRRNEAGDLGLRPNVQRRHVNPLWDVSIVTNYDGYRDSEARAGSRPLIVGLGDSFGFGWGVNGAESFYSLLEEKIFLGRSVELLNASVPGTGPSDQSSVLAALMDRHEPRLALLALFVGNDFSDVRHGGAEQFVVDDGLLVRKPLNGMERSVVDALKSRLIRSSRLLQLLRSAQLNLTRGVGDGPAGGSRGWDDFMREFAQVHRVEPDAETRSAIEQTLGLLIKMDNDCRARSVVFAVIVIPRSVQIYRDELEEMLDKLDWEESEVDWDEPQRTLNAWGLANGVPVIDLLPGFRRRHERNSTERLYYYPDSHLNARGHAAAAELIAEGLRAEPRVEAALAESP